jgi:hypothetical protein
VKFDYIKTVVQLFSESFKDIVKQYDLTANDIQLIDSLYTPNQRLPLERFRNKYGAWIATNLLRAEEPTNEQFMRDILDKWERFNLGDITGTTPENVIARVEAYEEERRQATMRTHTGHHGTTEYSAYERKKNKQAMKKELPSDADSTTIADNEYFTLRWIKTYKGSVKYGVQPNPTGWCISRPTDRQHWDSYTKNDGKRYWFLEFKGDGKSVADFYNKFIHKPLPEDKAERLLKYIRAFKGQLYGSDAVYDTVADDVLLKRISLYMASTNPKAKTEFEKIYNTFERKYNNKVPAEFKDPEEETKIAIEWIKTKPNEANAYGFNQTWNRPDVNNNHFANTLANYILRDMLPKSDIAPKVKETLAHQPT